jgi:branched-chain amino acid transport system ATP-binding protein
MEKFTKIRQEAQEILKMFNVPEDFPANLLPHGQRKLLDAAMAFAYRPKLLLLDEPTSGVSTAEKAKVMDTIMPNIEKSNTTTVIVEHDMEIVLRYSRRVIVMDQGKIFAQGIPQEVMEDPKVREVLLGIPASAKT